jgi:tRNA (cytidine/uridine-2'-O-)-methyltransferase
MVRVVLVHPEIPQNTGAIARTCVAAQAELHLIRPLGFLWGTSRLRRAGVDSWEHLRVYLHDSWSAFEAKLPPQARLFALTPEGKEVYTQVAFQPGDYLLFGSESRGLPPELRNRFLSLRIPMPGPTRSLNLSVAVGVVLFEALRQLANEAQGNQN